MASAREERPRYDEQYKKLFAFPRMVEDLLRAFVGRDLLGAIDVSTLRKLSSDYVSDELLTRRGDTVWRLRVPGGCACPAAGLACCCSWSSNRATIGTWRCAS